MGRPRSLTWRQVLDVAGPAQRELGRRHDLGLHATQAETARLLERVPPGHTDDTV
jgi:hypothetical protein